MLLSHLQAGCHAGCVNTRGVAWSSTQGGNATEVPPIFHKHIPIGPREGGKKTRAHQLKITTWECRRRLPGSSGSWAFRGYPCFGSQANSGKLPTTARLAAVVSLTRAEYGEAIRTLNATATGSPQPIHSSMYMLSSANKKVRQLSTQRGT